MLITWWKVPTLHCGVGRAVASVFHHLRETVLSHCKSQAQFKGVLWVSVLRQHLPFALIYPRTSGSCCSQKAMAAANYIKKEHALLKKMHSSARLFRSFHRATSAELGHAFDKRGAMTQKLWLKSWAVPVFRQGDYCTFWASPCPQIENKMGSSWGRDAVLGAA